MARIAKIVLGAAFAWTVLYAPAYAPLPGPVPIPEPSSFALLATGGITALGLYVISKWRKRK